MKTNFTLVLKSTLILILALGFTKSFSSTLCPTDSPVINLTANVENRQLVINWNMQAANASGYCEVQASTDGTTFSTIGLVLGADPKQSTHAFIFKQSLNKMKSGKVFYRILQVDDNKAAVASNIVKIAQ